MVFELDLTGRKICGDGIWGGRGRRHLSSGNNGYPKYH